jgi:hypothetical protein
MYLYADSARKKRTAKFSKPRNIVENFAFVWVLLALLGLYIITITSTSQPIFVAGNIIVEFLLLLYIVILGRARTVPNENGRGILDSHETQLDPPNTRYEDVKKSH